MLDGLKADKENLRNLQDILLEMIYSKIKSRPPTVKRNSKPENDISGLVLN